MRLTPLLKKKESFFAVVYFFDLPSAWKWSFMIEFPLSSTDGGGPALIEVAYEIAFHRF